MKLKSWITQALIPLGLAAAPAFLAPGPRAGEQESEEARGPSDRALELELEVLRGAHSEVEGLLKREAEDVARRAHGAITPGLKEALAQWEADAAARPALARRIASDLEAARLVQGLDLLVVVTAEDEIIATAAGPPVANGGGGGGGGEQQALARSALVLAAEEVFRDGRPASGFEWLPARFSARSAAASRPLGDKALFAAAAAPVWLRPESPQSVVLGGKELDSLEPSIRQAFPGKPDRFQWHAVAHDAEGQAVVFAGDRRGAVVTAPFYEQLLGDGASEEPAFEKPAGAPHTGRWGVLRARDGRVLAGWGLTLPPSFLQGLAGEGTTAPAGALGLLSTRVASWLPWACGAAGAALLLFWLLWRWLHLRRPAVLPARAPGSGYSPREAGSPPPAAAPRAGADLLAQFEVNWKTFASYTQDLLHEKLKEIEGAPQKGVSEVREQVARLTETLAEIKSDLAVARSEVKDTKQDVVEKVAHLVEQGSQEKAARSGAEEEILKKLETDLDRASSRFGNLDATMARLAEALDETRSKEIEDRVAAEVERLQAEWTQRLEAFAAEIEEAKRQGQALLDDLTRARELEGSLRGELAEQGEQAQALRDELETTKRDREAAWRREREVIEEIHTLKGREEAALARAAQAEGALDQLRAREESLGRELQEAHANEEKYREAIKEIYREEGRFQRDLQQKESDFAAERDGLHARVRALEAQVEDMGRKGSESREGEERLAALAEARLVEIQALQLALGALREEKETAEAEGRRREEELAELRAERASFHPEKQRSLEAENARLGSEVAKLARELSRERHEAANLAQSVEIHRVELDDLTAKATRLEEENQALRNESDRKTIELERSKAALDEREQELAPAKLALEKALESSLAEVQRIRQESEARSDESRAGRELAEQMLQAARADGERAERQLRDLEKRSRAGEEERLRLKAQLAEAEGRGQARLGELEARAAEADRRAAESARRLAEAQAAEKATRARLEAAAAESRATQDTATRQLALEKERNELSASLARLSQDLERSREEVEGIRRFHGALVDGCLPAAIAAVDCSLKVFAWNSRAEGLWGHPAQAALGKLLPDLPGKGIGREVLDLAQRALREARTQQLARTTLPGDRGKLRHVALSCDPILGPDGRPLGAILIAEEVTEKVEREIEAKLQALFNQSLTRSLPAALVVVDSQGRVISWNRTAESLLGITEAAALGAGFFQLKTPLARDAFRRQFEAARQDRSVHRVRVRFDVKGAPAVFTVTQAPFVGEGDAVRGAILLIQEAVEAVEAGKGSGPGSAAAVG